MARALRVRLIAIKKEINHEKLNVEDELAAMKEGHPEPFDKAIAEKICGLEVKNLRLKAQLNRAHLYGRLFSGDVIFRCIPCFILHDVLLNMTRTKSNVAGVIRYKCRRCGEELNSDYQP